MLKTRQSERSFLPYSVDLCIIEDIIDCARLAPSARNRQPLRYVIVDDESLRLKLSEIVVFGKFFKDCPVVVAVLSEDVEYKLEDSCAATENILLASKAYSLGSCWVAGYGKPFCKDVEKLLCVPKEYQLMSLIAIGKVSKPWQRPEKKDLADIISYNKFE